MLAETDEFLASQKSRNTITDLLSARFSTIYPQSLESAWLVNTEIVWCRFQTSSSRFALAG